MLNNPEKTSTARSKLPEPSNQSYLASKYSKANLAFTLFAFLPKNCFFQNLKLAHRPVGINFRHYFVPFIG